jgi:nucleotide-binding universal stress UspA family protein
MFDQILVAVDQSNHAQAALRASVEMAKLLGAHLTAIHVKRAGEGDETKATIDVKGPRLLRRLSKLPKVAAICRTGQPVAEIVAAAEELGAKLIVMGTHGRGPLRQLFLGSTAEGVARFAPCPVLTVQQIRRRRAHGNGLRGALGASHRPPPLFGKILVAVDASESALAALRTAVRFADQVGGQVAIVHVANTVYPWRPPLTETGLAPVSEIRRRGQLLLDRIVADLPGSNHCQTILRDGEPTKEILAAAAQWDADLIVLGTQGAGHFQQFVLGSVASGVVRGAACPVLLVAADMLEPSPADVRYRRSSAST